jgi:hypothetical protein
VSTVYEVVWPLYRGHYLTIEEPVIMPTAMVRDVSRTVDTPAVDGRELAARALRAGAGCTQARVGELLGVSRRTVGRTADLDVSVALGDAQALTAARACLERADATTEERDAAEAWLLQAERDERPSEEALPEAGSARTRAPSVHEGRAGNGSGKTRAKRPAARPAPCAAGPPRASLPLVQVEALTREQQRIERRTLVLGSALTTLDPAPMRDALVELVAEIAESARVIGRLLQPAGDGK